MAQAHATRPSLTALRPWVARLGLLAAAVASVATSPARWRLAAKAPEAAAAQGQLVLVEASGPPSLTLTQGNHSQIAEPVGGRGTWGGSAEYFVPAGATLTRVELVDICKNQGCSGCEPPPDAFVRVARSTPVQTWRQEIRLPTQVTELAAASPSNALTSDSVRLVIDTSELVHVEIDYTQPRPESVPEPYISTSRQATWQQVTVSWSNTGAAAQVGWVPRVIIEGFCRGDAPCAPPPPVQVRVAGAKVLEQAR